MSSWPEVRSEYGVSTMGSDWADFPTFLRQRHLATYDDLGFMATHHRAIGIVNDLRDLPKPERRERWPDTYALLVAMYPHDLAVFDRWHDLLWDWAWEFDPPALHRRHQGWLADIHLYAVSRDLAAQCGIDWYPTTGGRSRV